MNELDPTIKVSRRSTLNRTVKGGSESIANGKTSSGNADRVTLSESSKTQASVNGVKTIASEIRQDLVSKFRDVLRKGSYEVKADEIADKIVQKIRENKSPLVL